ncbi:GlxA family transcriptional regulator [Sulfitobacter sp. SK012]|uniref:GlxA family transcriptional regulator n=1 Tax=Sulfitobacter sp. SK012 TaxID=1389005 RepID=UPI0020C7A570|nr:GlxA family transcriptional regulator [Sulfitobacter sp. SK012]
MHKSKIIQIGFLISPDFPMACLTSMIEPLRAANEIAGTTSFGWSLISEQGTKVVSSAGVSFEPDISLKDVSGVDLLILLSSPVSKFANPKSAHGVLRSLDRQGVILGGVSGGVFPLVRAGVMEGHRCSVHWCYEAAFRSEFPTIEAVDEVIVQDGRRYTVSGAAAAFDLALQLIDDELGVDIANEVACWFQHPMTAAKGVKQRVPIQTNDNGALPDLVGRAVSLFSEDLSNPISVAEVALRLGVTPRQVERAFKKATGQNPTHYYRAMRMKIARQLVQHSSESIAQIAFAVGYATSTPLIAHYKHAFGVTPHQDRTQINAFRVLGSAPVPST